MAANFDATRDFLRNNIPAADYANYCNRAWDQAMRSPLGRQLFPDGDKIDWKRIQEMSRILCLDGLLPEQPKGRDDDHPPRDGDQRPDGEPGTDYPAGKPPPDWDIGGEGDVADDPQKQQHAEERAGEGEEPGPSGLWRPLDHQADAPADPEGDHP
jgi:hypothetical protein